MLAFALFLGLCGVCSATVYVIAPLTARPSVQTNVLFGALAGIGGLLGAGLLWQSVIALRGREPGSAARALPPFGVFVAAFFIAVPAGIGVLALRDTALLPVVLGFPFLHFIAASAPSFAVIAYVARRVGASSSSRAAFLAFVWGACGSTTIAILIELILGVMFVLVVIVMLAIQPNGATQLDELQRAAQRLSRLDDTSVLTQWLANPLVIAGVLFYFALLIPVVEEALKTLVLAPMNAQRTRVWDALLWGICAGAGFAWVENLFNAGNTVSDWGVVILLRAGTAMMHIANGAWMGRGWYAARVERRWGQLVLAYLVSVVIHAVWNAAALVMTAGTFVLNASTAVLPASLLVGAMAMILAVLTALALGSVLYATQRQSREQHVDERSVSL